MQRQPLTGPRAECQKRRIHLAQNMSFFTFWDFFVLACHFGEFSEVTRQRCDFLESPKNRFGSWHAHMSQNQVGLFPKIVGTSGGVKCTEKDTQKQKKYFWTF